jgi:hypothetical protein
VGTLMRRMGIQALYRKPNTSRKHPTHPVLYVFSPLPLPIQHVRATLCAHGMNFLL